MLHQLRSPGAEFGIAVQLIELAWPRSIFIEEMDEHVHLLTFRRLVL
ncbi:MAG: hypothetical protein ACR2H9_16450 [Longimicrobiaceae bacterium]